MIFDYQPSLRDKPQRLTAEKWAELTRSELVNKAVIDFQRGDAAAKKRLPAVMWQASFGGGTRSNKNAIPSGLYMLDLDHLEGNTAKIASEQIVPHIKECGICLIHTTPSGHGLRVVARMMQAQSAFKTISEFQVWLAEKIGFKAADVDAATHDMARMSFRLRITFTISTSVCSTTNPNTRLKPLCSQNRSSKLRGAPLRPPPRMSKLSRAERTLNSPQILLPFRRTTWA